MEQEIITPSGWSEVKRRTFKVWIRESSFCGVTGHDCHRVVSLCWYREPRSWTRIAKDKNVGEKRKKRYTTRRGWQQCINVLLQTWISSRLKLPLHVVKIPSQSPASCVEMFLLICVVRKLAKLTNADIEQPIERPLNSVLFSGLQKYVQWLCAGEWLAVQNEFQVN